MRKVTLAILVFTMAVQGFADKKIQGATTLKDSQPTGTPDKKQHQVYDLSFSAEDKNYTCRTAADKSVDATDFVVGSSINYEIDGDKVKIKTPQGKKLGCKVVRVEAATPAPAAK